MLLYGLGGPRGGFSSSGGGPAAADVRPRPAPPPPQATSVRRAPRRTAATRTRALPCMCSPSLITRVRFGRTGSLATRPTSGRVVRRCAAGEPVPERVRILCQTPFLEDRQRHRPHSTLARARRETLLLQPGLELVRRGVGGDGLLEQPSLDREADCVGGRIALAPLAPGARAAWAGGGPPARGWGRGRGPRRAARGRGGGLSGGVPPFAHRTRPPAGAAAARGFGPPARIPAARAGESRARARLSPA